MIIDKKKLPKGEMIMRGAIHFPEYSESGSVHYSKGCALIGGYHVFSQTFHVFGELEFESIRPTSVDQPVVDFLKDSPVDVYYCGQNKDIIKRYRKEIGFASGLAGVDVSIPHFKTLDSSQSRHIIWSKVQANQLKYIKNGVVYNGINRFSVSKNDFPPQMKALVCLLNGIERSLYNDERFDNTF